MLPILQWRERNEMSKENVLSTLTALREWDERKRFIGIRVSGYEIWFLSFFPFLDIQSA